MSPHLSQGILDSSGLDWDKTRILGASARNALASLAFTEAGYPSRIQLEAIDRAIASPATSAMNALAAGHINPDAWNTGLSARFEAFDPLWARGARFEDAFFGFSRLARLSDAASEARPFNPRISEIIFEELGAAVDEEDLSPSERDTAAIEAGLNTEIISFERSTFTQVVLSAGFNLVIPIAVVPQAIEQADTGVEYNPNHAFTISQAEQHLRQTVVRELMAVAGPSWLKQRTPEAFRNKWRDKQEYERQARRPVYELIQYADLMDLADIICSGANWRDVFKPIFLNADDLRTSMRRLNPIRNNLMHARPIGMSDVVTMFCEVTRLFRALGIEVQA